MHEVASMVASLVSQAAHLLAFITPANINPPPF